MQATNRLIARIMVAVLLLLPGTAAWTQAAPTLHDINDVNGFREFVDELGSTFEDSVRDAGPSVPDAVKQAMLAALEGGFDGPAMQTAIESSIADKFTPTDLQVLGDFYFSPLGRKIAALETATAHDLKNKAEGKSILADVEQHDPERLALYRAISDSTNAVDSNEAAALNMTYAMLYGTASGSPIPLDDKTIMSMARHLTGNIRDRLQQSILEDAAISYRDLPMAELRAYSAFLATPQGRLFYDQQMFALDKAISAEVRAFGERLAKILRQKKA